MENRDGADLIGTAMISVIRPLAAILGVGLMACRSAPEPDARTSTPIVRTLVVHAESAAGRAFTGVVTARVQSNIGFRVAGKVTSRAVDTGQSVRAGQLLMHIDNTDYLHAIDVESGAVAAARARSAQADIDEARARRLLEGGAVAKKTHEEAKTDADAAHALLAAAQARIQVARDEAQYSDLRADADGIVVDVLAEPGQVVAAGQTVIKLAHAGPREAAVFLPETLRPAVGSVANATLYASSTPLRATLRQLSGAADAQTRTFEARYVLDADAERAPLGATVTVRIPEAKTAAGAEPALLEVPLGAIRDGNGDGGRGSGVWVVVPRTSVVAFHAVAVRRFGEETVIIESDLHDGDRIVALGAHLLHDGDRVVVAKTEADK